MEDSQGIIYKVCRMYCVVKEDQEDLKQEILIQLWKSYGSFRGDAKFSTWMYRVSLNVALQYVAKQKRKQRNKLQHEGLILARTEPSEQEERRLSALYQAISTLSKVEKALVLLYLDHKNNDEISEVMGITPNYVRVRMNRIKNKLRKTLNT